MIRNEINRAQLVPSFNGGDASLAPGSTQLSYRKAYYQLVNVEEHPEVLPLAFDTVTSHLAAATPASASLGDIPASVSAVIDRLTAQRDRFSRPWKQPTEELSRRQVLHYFVQYMPTALVDGCWLQAALRVSTAHTPLGAALTGLYMHQVRAFVADPGRHFIPAYRAVYQHLGAPLEEVASHSFAERPDFLESSLVLPVILLAIAQFPRSFPAESMGLNLAWQYFDLSAFGPDLVRDTCAAYGLPELGGDLGNVEYREKAREMARDAAVELLTNTDASDRGEAWSRLLSGVEAGIRVWTQWFDATSAAAPSGPPDPRQEMIDLLWRKAPHASGYHGERRLGARKIDEHLDPQSFNGPAVLDALSKSPWVKPGNAQKSPMLNRLIGFGGPMMAVFSPVEQQIMRTWIDSLPPREELASTAPPPANAGGGAIRPTVHEPQFVRGRGWTADVFRQRSQQLHGKCSVRELYYHLVNVEFHPEILPMAERFAHERLERSMAMLTGGERPIPSRRYDPAALEQWVYTKHREQVDSYRPPSERPEAPKDAFIEATVQLAPLILIDGGWLQGMASPALIHTTVGRMLFHVLAEEIGEGKSKEHHANIYRNLLAAMGVEAPPVDTWEFARWERLLDESFEVPALWLSISCFPRHFLPEILGLNLAVELAGVGGPYMEARDTLRRFRYPTLFVDVHNAADNVSVGHSAWAMNAIKRYLDELAERDGPHNVDRTWQRIWSGVRATLPQIGRVRLLAHRIRQRFFGEDPRLVPLIFPS